MSPRNTAARVLAKIAANDPRTVRPSEAVTQAWAEHFDRAGITQADALAAVTELYRTPPDRMPLAADIVNIAKRIAGQRQSTRRADIVAACRDCDECGWLLGPDRAVIDPAQRCTHPGVVDGSPR
ncbi:hypothetical protein E2F47_27800 [Mycobacterium eburneum]|nr:hypothetical protein [Mycobacterium eburneum]TDH44773.1 hypothetical protein E2F47_27800 [Mycobacterium eburneum]